MLSGETSYGKKRKYDHMKPGDVAIWERFMEKYPDAYKSVIYDLSLGQGSIIPDGTPDNLAKDFRLLGQRKIDVVGIKDDNIDIIEVKPNAGPSAVGQILNYIELYKGYIDPEAKPNALIVTDQQQRDMSQLAFNFGIKVIQV